MTYTITDENAVAGTTTAHHAADKDLLHLSTSSAEKQRHLSSGNVVGSSNGGGNTNNNTVKVRRFEFGSTSQRSSNSKSPGGGIAQAKSGKSGGVHHIQQLNPVAVLGSCNQTPGGTSSIYNEERLSPSIKFTLNCDTADGVREH